jgi:uncharacterized membrane protein (TIGR02234 family)
MTKGRLLSIWIALATFAYVSASQDWFTLSMSPEGKTVQLASYDGLTAYSSLSATLMLNFAGILAVAFVGSIGRKITAGLLALLNLGVLIWSISRIAVQDISGLAKQVEQMTGIAAAHGIKDVAVATQPNAYWFIAALAATMIANLLVLVTESRWPKRTQKTEAPSKTSKTVEPKDSIGIWDSQRR